MNTFRTLLAGLLLLPGLLLAANIRDEAKLFTPDGVKKAQQIIDQLQKTHKSELFIETFAKAEDPEAAKKENKDRAQYFQKWAADRYKELKVDGVYVLICKEPAYVQVASGKKMEAKGFDSKKRTELANLMIEQFKKKEFDAGLLTVVNEVSKTLQAKGLAAKPGTERVAAKSGTDQAAESTAVPELPAWTSWLCIGLMALLGVWLVVGLIRAFSGAGQIAGQPAGAGGGGFFSSLLGGLVGAAAGMYLYNTFFGSGTSSVFGSSPMGDPSAPPVDNSPQTDGGGGDWGDDAGGGDWGGDAGGGDWGGDGGGGGDW